MDKRTFPENLYAAVFGYAKETEFSIPADAEEAVEIALSFLKEREREAVEMVYKRGKKIKDVADAYGLSNQRASQIFHHALRKLRHPRTSKAMELGARGFEALLKNERSKGQVRIEELGLSARLYNCLCRYGKYYLSDVCRTKPAEYMNMINFGCKCAHELLRKVKDAGVDYVLIHLKDFDKETERFFGIRLEIE